MHGDGPPLTPRRPSELDQRIAAIERLLAVFRFERVTYLAVTIVSLAFLLASATSVALKQGVDSPELVGLCGSGGAIAFATSRLLRMWSDAMRLLLPMTREVGTDGERT